MAQSLVSFLCLVIIKYCPEFHIASYPGQFENSVRRRILYEIIQSIS